MIKMPTFWPKRPFFKSGFKQWVPPALLLPRLLLLASLTGCGNEVKIPEVPAQASLKPEGPALATLTPDQEQTIRLEQGSVRFMDLGNTVETTGQVQAATPLMAHIYTPVSGPVTQVPVMVGQPIRQGQVLAVLKSDDVGQLQADLLQQWMQNAADGQQAKVQMGFSQTAYAREQRLFNERISARADMEAARTQYEKDRAAIAALNSKQQAILTSFQSRMSLLGADPGVAQQVINHRRIIPFITLRAPREGDLISRQVNPGEIAEANKELFTVADLNRVWLVGNVYEKDIPKVSMGQSVHVTLDGVPDKTFDGSVSYVGEMLDPQTRTLEVRVEVNNAGLLLKPNMFARMSIQAGTRKVLAVPSGALQRSGDNTFAYVPVKPHVYEERLVTIGNTHGGYTEILSGLKANEPVVSNGTLALKGELLKLTKD